MKNKDKDLKQKVAEYRNILGIYVPDDKETGEAPDPVDGDEDADN